MIAIHDRPDALIGRIPCGKLAASLAADQLPIVSHNAPIPASPAWLTQSRLATAPSTRTLDWLFDEGSLTRRLTKLCDNTFSVTPLFEGWQALRDDECAALELPSGSLGWVREVYLRGHGQPWVFARSVAARSVLQQGGLNLDELGSRSLGELLFCDQAFERQAIEVCRYPASWLPAEHRADNLWGRRSRFNRGSLSLLVAEIFLPDLWQAVDTAQETC